MSGKRLPEDDEFGVLEMLFASNLVTGVEATADGGQAWVLFSANAGEQISEHIRRQTASLDALHRAEEHIADLEGRVEDLTTEVETLNEALLSFISHEGQA